MPTGDKKLIEKDKERSLTVWPEANKVILELKNLNWSEIQNVQEEN